jgi:hypothetical protein
MAAYTVDILAVGFFILEWTVYAVTLERSAYGRDSPARVLLRAWLSRLVRQSLGPVSDHRSRGDRDLAAAVRLQRLARDGELGRGNELFCLLNQRALAFA